MLTREELEHLERERLAPYAALAAESRGRRYPEEKARSRTDFQRDRDRIIHCTAFRRMEYKTQVFVNHEGDHYRTRLTHSLEASQIGRSVGRSLRLNEDLIEALVLAHDLGHTPFGHSGERAMSDLMKDHGGFEHNGQSLRVVDFLERRYPDFPGLNLTYEVREGIIKHTSSWDHPEGTPPDLAPEEQPTIEAQLTNYADEIAYSNHDVDDGLSSDLIDIESLTTVGLWKEASGRVRKRYPSLRYPDTKHVTISAMITILVEELVRQTTENIRRAGVRSISDVRAYKGLLASYSPAVTEEGLKLRTFLWENLYTHFRVVRMEEKAKRMLSDLFHAYMARPQQLPTEFRERMKTEPAARIICDYIAGMTDRFALEEHQKLFDPLTRV
ncbi:MAG: deoxyguanosinetriphosphate triphosphohydrolase [Pseudomonadota bacterium]